MRSGGGCTNSAYFPIIAHEYGHFIVDQLFPRFNAGDSFHEGVADAIPSLMSSTNLLGVDFCGDGAPVRDLDEPNVRLNTCEAYPPEWCLGHPGHGCQINCMNQHCLGLALSGAFWDTRKNLIVTYGEASTCAGGTNNGNPCTGAPDCPGGTCNLGGIDRVNRLFADFLFISNGFLDQSVLPEVLIADDDDLDLSNGTPHETEILDAFTLHGWLHCGSNHGVEVKWEGPPPGTDPIEGEDYYVFYYVQGSACLPDLSLRTTEKEVDETLFEVDKWSVGRGTELDPGDLGSVYTDWDPASAPHNITVEVGSTEDSEINCRDVNVVDIAPQSLNNWSGIILDVTRNVAEKAKCSPVKDPADPNFGAGGRISGSVPGSIDVVSAQGIGTGSSDSGALEVGMGMNQLALLGGLGAGSEVRTPWIAALVHLAGELDGTLAIEGSFNATMDVLGTGVSSGELLVDDHFLTDTFIAGDMDGRIAANANSIGGGDLTGDVTANGVFNGDICADNLSAGAALPSNIDLVFGPDATICTEPACPHDVDFDNGPTPSRLIYVDADAPSPGSGSSWQTAYTELETAVGQAAGADIAMEIWVAAGTYLPTERTNQSAPRSATFQLANRVLMYGGFAGTETKRCDRDPATNQTILSGDIGYPDYISDNSYHVVIGSGTGASAVLDGVTITGGNADGTGDDDKGGGVLILNGSPTLTDCNIIMNVADEGGGLYNSLGGPHISGTTFTLNLAYDGGAIYNDNGGPVLVDCAFFNNQTAYDGGGVLNTGVMTLTNCAFSGNLTFGDGGAMVSVGGSSTFTNCTFSENWAGADGGGMTNNLDSSATLSNCIFWGNTDSGPIDASAQIFNDGTSVAVVAHSCVQDDDPDDGNAYTGTGNIDDDPQFVDPDGADDLVGTEDDDLHLYASSPCIDAGDDSDLTVQTDLEGNPRQHDAGGPGGGIVDMGVYEFTCGAAESPATPAAGEQSSYPKNRYLSFVPGSSAGQTAIRVTFAATNISEFDYAVGRQWWVGPPVMKRCEHSGKGFETAPKNCPAALPTDTFWTAPLQCDPYYVDWSAKVGTGEVLHVYDSAITSAPGSQIVPDSTYEIQAIEESCDPGMEGDYSAPLSVTTSKWGDICGPAGGACSGPPDGIVDVANDVNGVLEKFANTNSLQKARTDVEPEDVDLKVNVADDVLFVLDAFTGGQYPFGAPKDCE